MKAVLCILFLCLISLGFSIMIPMSRVPVFSDDNLITGLVRCDPEDKLPETLQTKCWLWQDDGYLVAHFECEIDSTFYRGSVSVRDKGQQCDYVRVQLITIPDAYFAYYYSATPSGTIFDAVRNQDLSVDNRWNSKYSYDSQVEDKLWTVTMRIPLGELRFKQELPYNWKIIVSRYYYKAESMYSHPFSHTNMRKGYFTNAQDITLSQKISRSMNFSFRPYLVRSYNLIDKSSSFDPDNIGMDIAFDPSQRVRIKVSVNPDFSDVPPDDAADNYNSKYPPWLSENRFFFTEDLDVFGSDSDTFYSRNIAKPQLAFKVTGNAKSVNWGLLGAKDKEMRDGDDIINSDDYYQVISVKPSWRTLKLNNAILSRMNDNYFNHVYEGSVSKLLGDSFSVGANITASVKKDAGMNEQNSGYKAGGFISANPGDWNAWISASTCSEDLEIDMGYPIETDYNGISWNGGYSSSMLPGRIKYYGANLWGGYNRYHPRRNPIDELNQGANAYVTFSNKLSFSATQNIGTSLDWANTQHNIHSSQASFNANPWDSFGFGINYAIGNTIVYQLYDTYKTQRWVINLWGQPTDKLSYSGGVSLRQYDYNKVSVVNGNVVRLDNQYAFVNAEISYTHSGSLQIKGAINYNNNESRSSFGSLGYHSNLRYEFKPEYFLYAGMQSNQYQDEKSTLSAPLGSFRKYGSTAYVKLAISL